MNINEGDCPLSEMKCPFSAFDCGFVVSTCIYMNCTLTNTIFNYTRIHIYEFVNFLSSLFTLCYFFLYLKIVLYARDCSCISRKLKYNVYSSKIFDLHTCLELLCIHEIVTLLMISMLYQSSC